LPGAAGDVRGGVRRDGVEGGKVTPLTNIRLPLSLAMGSHMEDSIVDANGRVVAVVSDSIAALEVCRIANSTMSEAEQTAHMERNLERLHG
jgi:hypothetical protein